jgi:K(+)-stimulated pyrophosphate-energized sodium pump
LLEYVFAVSALSLGVASYTVSWILKQDAGTERMRDISNATKVGAEAYLGGQYRTISVIAIITAVILALGIRDPSSQWAVS